VNGGVRGRRIWGGAERANAGGQGEHCYDHNLASIDIPASWLKQGDNIVRVGRQADQLEIEAAFNTPRTIAHPTFVPSPILAVTNDNLLTGRPAGASTLDLTTYLFSQGGDTPINYAVGNKTGAQTPWLSRMTPRPGTLTP